MAISGVGKLVCLVLAFMVVVAPYTEATITCSEVETKLSGCLSYMRNGGSVSSTCCNGARALNSEAKTTADRQKTCQCLKTLYSSISGINLNYASKLPSACGISNFHYKISTSTDCSKVQ